MGQQQLLLLVLSALIVGAAVVVGINMFSQNAGQANQDAVIQDVLTIASRAQGQFRRPVQMGGTGRHFNAVTLSSLNFPSSNANGTYTFDGSADVTATITGTGKEDPDGDSGLLKVTAIITPDSIRTLTVDP